MKEATEPTPINPEATAKMLTALYADLDNLVNADPAKLQDILQDKMVPILKAMHGELAACLYYVGMHEDRIVDLEENQGSALVPEDAEILTDYIGESLAMFKRLAQDASMTNLQPLIDKGEEALRLVQEITLPDDEEDDDGPEPERRPKPAR